MDLLDWSPRVNKLLNVLFFVSTMVIVILKYWYGRGTVREFPMRFETLSNGKVGFVSIVMGEPEPTVTIVLDDRWRAMDEFGRSAILTREVVRCMAVMKVHEEAGGGEKGWAAAGEFLANQPDDHPTFLEVFRKAHHDLDVYSPEELINWEATHDIPEKPEDSQEDGDTEKEEGTGSGRRRTHFRSRIDFRA